MNTRRFRSVSPLPSTVDSIDFVAVVLLRESLGRKFEFFLDDSLQGDGRDL